MLFSGKPLSLRREEAKVFSNVSNVHSLQRGNPCHKHAQWIESIVQRRKNCFLRREKSALKSKFSSLFCIRFVCLVLWLDSRSEYYIFLRVLCCVDFPVSVIAVFVVDFIVVRLRSLGWWISKIFQYKQFLRSSSAVWKTILSCVRN